MIIYNNKVFDLADNIKFKKTGGRKKNKYFVFDDNRIFPIKGNAAKLFASIIHYDSYNIKNILPYKAVLKHFQRFIDLNWINEISEVKNKILYLSCYNYATSVNEQYYIINFLYRTIDRISKETYDLITKNQYEGIPPEELFYLFSRRYIRERCDRDEAEVFISHLASKIVYLIFSYDCSMRCTYCFEKNQNRGIEMSESTLEKSIKLIDSLSVGSGVTVNFYGGEPLLDKNKDKLYSVINRFKKNKNIYFRFISNGLNVKKYINLFDSVRERIKNFVITLDGIRDIHNKRRISDNPNGTFDSVIESICFLSERGYRVSIRINIDAENLGCQEELIKYVNKVARRKKNITLEYHRVENKTDFNYKPIDYLECYKLYIKAKKLSKCNVVFNLPVINAIGAISINKDSSPKVKEAYCTLSSNYVIDHDGQIYSCNEAMAVNDFRVGSVDCTERTVPESNEVDSRCKNCNLYLACYGKCPLENYYSKKYNMKTCDRKQIEDTLKEYILINQKNIYLRYL